jgi:hypothetical protein
MEREGEQKGAEQPNQIDQKSETEKYGWLELE